MMVALSAPVSFGKPHSHPLRIEVAPYPLTNVIIWRPEV